MKLARFAADGEAHLGLVEADRILDLTAAGLPYPTMLAVIAEADAALPAIAALAAIDAPRLPLASVELLAPVEKPGKYLAIGMNYLAHAAEVDKLGIARNARQTWFNKQTTCLNGPFGEIEPGVTEKLDYEVELGVVIGRPARHVSEETALDHIFGYFVANDISARDWQFHSQTFTMGKSFDTHGPIGPWIVTADEIADPQDLELRCLVNGEVRQHSRTGKMIAPIAAQIAYLSTAFTLESGDLLATGTPEGVGVSMEPPSFLQPGDVVRCEVENIGFIENRVRAQ